MLLLPAISLYDSFFDFSPICLFAMLNFVPSVELRVPNRYAEDPALGNWGKFRNGLKGCLVCFVFPPLTHS